MTHTEPLRYHPPSTTIEWLHTDEAARTFLGWCADPTRSSMNTVCRAHLITVGYWSPSWTFPMINYYIASLTADDQAFRLLHDGLFDEWVGSDDEHTAFHRWAERDTDPAICSGCWS